MVDGAAYYGGSMGGVMSKKTKKECQKSSDIVIVM